jgi:hypothetical protein
MAFANSTKGIMLVIGGFLGNFAVGSVLAWGILEAYIASYLRSYDSSVSINSMLVMFPISAIGEMAGVVLGIKSAKRLGPRISYAIGGA